MEQLCRTLGRNALSKPRDDVDSSAFVCTIIVLPTSFNEDDFQYQSLRVAAHRKRWSEWNHSLDLQNSVMNALYELRNIQKFGRWISQELTKKNLFGRAKDSQPSQIGFFRLGWRCCHRGREWCIRIKHSRNYQSIDEEESHDPIRTRTCVQKASIGVFERLTTANFLSPKNNTVMFALYRQRTTYFCTITRGRMS